MKIKRKILINFLSIVSVLLFWQVIVSLGLINPLFLSSPTDVFFSGLNLLSSGKFIPHFISSLKIFFAGYVMAIFFGVTAGLLIGSNKVLDLFFHPHIFLLGSLPLIAIVPLFMIWLGVGYSFKVFVVAFMAFIPVLINTIEGVKNTNKDLLRMAKSFGASKTFILKNIIFFSTLPYIFSAMKIASTRGMVGVVVADLFGISSGLGYLIYHYGFTYKTANLLFVIFTIFMINLTVISIINKIKKSQNHWL